MPRLKAKVDNNHKLIMHAFRKLGCQVLSLHQLGKGCPDMLVQIGSNLVLVECKQTIKSSFTPGQLEFYQNWKVYVVITIEDVINLVAKIRQTAMIN